MHLPRTDVRSSFRAGAGVVLLALPLAACTSLLGIDGNYTTTQAVIDGTGGSQAEGGASTIGTGGRVATAGAGGTAGSGGSGGEPPRATGGTGGAEPPPPLEAGSPDCKPGAYVGTLQGQHAPALTVVGVPFGVSGDFTFTLSGTGRVLQITQSSGFDSALAWGKWTLLGLTGQFDCDAQMLTASINGKLSATPALSALVGTLSGSLTPGGAAGTWQEKEDPGPGNAANCNPNAAPTGTGCGTWNVKSRP